MSARGKTDWSAWSTEAVRIMRERNQAWVARWGLSGAPYSWALETGELVFAGEGFEVVADLCCVGSASARDRTFLWSWANPGIPERARRGVDRVREFGAGNDLPMLTTPEWRGGEPEGKEMVAVAARVLDAEGVWIERSGEVTLFFTLSRFRTRARSAG